MQVFIREEHPDDIKAIRSVNEKAFGQSQESHIVDALRSNAAALLSLVAIVDNEIIGHIMYSPATLQCEQGEILGAALGPMAVLPEYQRKGIGSKLVDTGNQELRAKDVPFIIVLGHPHYYPRFGFEPASRHGIRCEWEVPDDVFMVLILDQGKMSGVCGVAKYRAEFSDVQ